MKFRRPDNDVLNSAGRLYMTLGLLPVLLVIMVVRGDAPAWAYISIILFGAVLVPFTFVFLPAYQVRVAERRQRRAQEFG